MTVSGKTSAAGLQVPHAGGTNGGRGGLIPQDAQPEGDAQMAEAFQHRGELSPWRMRMLAVQRAKAGSTLWRCRLRPKATVVRSMAAVCRFSSGFDNKRQKPGMGHREAERPERWGRWLSAWRSRFPSGELRLAAAAVNFAMALTAVESGGVDECPPPLKRQGKAGAARHADYGHRQCHHGTIRHSAPVQHKIKAEPL